MRHSFLDPAGKDESIDEVQKKQLAERSVLCAILEKHDWLI